MNLQTRLKRMETSVCAAEACLVCEVLRYANSVFHEELKRQGVDPAGLPVDIELSVCSGCGAQCACNMCDMETALRREWHDLSTIITRKLQARTFDDELHRSLTRERDLLNRNEAQTARFYGKDYPAVKQATDAMLEAMGRWFDEHAAEVRQVMSRPPLVERRGLAVG